MAVRSWLALLTVLSACSFGLPGSSSPSSDPDDDVMPPTSTLIEWIGEARVQRDGYDLPSDRVLADQPLDVCVQTYPAGIATHAIARWTSPSSGSNPDRRELAMTNLADDAGPFQHNTLWCAQLPASDVSAGALSFQLVAFDAGGAIRTIDLAVTVAREVPLFADAAHAAASWRMAGPGSFTLSSTEPTLVAQPRQDLGLYWAAIPTPADFDLALDWQLARTDDNSGIFLRFRDPDTFGYDNPAWVGVHDGLEVQIDDIARPDGADIHRTGALYEQPGTYVRPTASTPGTWRHYDIQIRGARVTVLLDGALVSDTTFAGDPQRPDRALPGRPGAPRFIGLQSHTGAVSFRNVRLRLP